jgi:hypothetical protein
VAHVAHTEGTTVIAEEGQVSEPTAIEPDQHTSDPAWAAPGDNLVQQIRAKPIVAAVTLLLLVLLLLDLFGRTKVDGWAIVLVVMIILPWSLPAMLGLITSLSDAFAKSNLKSLQIGNFKIEQLEQRVNEQAEQLASQRKILDDLALYSMAFYIYDKLKYLSLGTTAEHKAALGEYKYVQDETFDHDLRYLRDHGYLELFQISQLVPGENLVGKLVVTEMGRRFVELKEARLRPAMPSVH